MGNGDWLRKAMEKARRRQERDRRKVIPNCAKCRWSTGNAIEIVCDAQGKALAWDVYNNRACRKLYEER